MTQQSDTLQIFQFWRNTVEVWTSEEKEEKREIGRETLETLQLSRRSK